MEAHGGYVCRLAPIDAKLLVSVARQALISDGAEDFDCALAVSVSPRHRVMRLSYDGAHTYGRAGALWYEKHHALAKLLSRATHLTVHAYVLDPDDFELVATDAQGSRVGGETLRYEDAELPDLDDDSFDDGVFDRLKDRWPIGHLAKILGLSRAELERLPRAATALFELDGRTEIDGHALDALAMAVERPGRSIRSLGT